MDQGNSLSLFTALGEWLQQINGILLVIGLCSVVAIAVFIERLKYLNEIDIDTETLLLELKSAIQQGNIVEAVSLCETHEGAVSNIIKAGIANHERSRERIEYAMEMRGMVEIAKMEKNARILSHRGRRVACFMPRRLAGVTGRPRRAPWAGPRSD